MGIGVSVFLLAVGAILAFAVHATAPGANVGMIGIVLMIAGGIGFLVSLALAASNRGRPHTVDERVIERDQSHPAPGPL